MGVRRYLVSRLLPLALASLTLALACRRAPGAARTTPRDQYLILAEELAATNRDNLYDAVRQLRPTWFSRVNRQRSGDEGIVVYLDDRQIGESTAMRSFSARAVASVRYLAPTEAQVRFGQLNMGRPAIVLASAKERQ